MGYFIVATASDSLVGLLAHTYATWGLATGIRCHGDTWRSDFLVQLLHGFDGMRMELCNNNMTRNKFERIISCAEGLQTLSDCMYGQHGGARHTHKERRKGCKQTHKLNMVKDVVSDLLKV